MSRKRILLVEDDPGVRESCAELLRDLGHTVVAVDDGAVALSEIPRLRPDVILVDAEGRARRGCTTVPPGGGSP